MSLINIKKKTIRAINRMNRKLHTNFSYVFCLEELDVIKMIHKNKESSDEYISEHLASVLGLLKKGLEEEYCAKHKTRNGSDELDRSFDLFVRCFIQEIEESGYVKSLKYPFVYKLFDNNYKVPFGEYDYALKNDKISDINSLIDSYETFYTKLSKHKIPKSGDPLFNTLINLNYYGPMTLLNGYKSISRKSQKYGAFTKSNPYNNVVKKHFLFGYNKLVKKCDKLFEKNTEKYYYNQLDVEIKRLEIEKERLGSMDTRYDYYFDYFMWRMLNDLDFITLKRLGGLRKFAELININVKNGKKVSKGPLEIDIDHIEVVSETTIKTKEVTSKGKNNPLEIKEFDLEEINRNIRKEERVREERQKTFERRR